MKIEIRKVQETVNDVPSEPKYTVYIERGHSRDLVYGFSEEEMRELTQTLAKKFLTHSK